MQTRQKDRQQQRDRQTDARAAVGPDTPSANSASVHPMCPTGHVSSDDRVSKRTQSAAEQEQQTTQQDAQTDARQLDAADLLTMRQHFREIQNTAKRADSWLARTADVLDRADRFQRPDFTSLESIAYRRQNIRSYMSGIRHVLAVLDARTSE